VDVLQHLRAGGLQQEGPFVPEITSPMDPKLFTELHVLYRLYDQHERLLYIGITNNPCLRFRNHQLTSEWWADAARCTFEYFPNRVWLQNAERSAIQRERPLHNKRHDSKRALRKKVSADEWTWLHQIGPYTPEVPA
jgi:predicted GIY-YIG superfamily endonuclease